MKFKYLNLLILLLLFVNLGRASEGAQDKVPSLLNLTLKSVISYAMNSSFNRDEIVLQMLSLPHDILEHFLDFNGIELAKDVGENDIITISEDFSKIVVHKTDDAFHVNMLDITDIFTNKHSQIKLTDSGQKLPLLSPGPLMSSDGSKEVFFGFDECSLIDLNNGIIKKIPTGSARFGLKVSGSYYDAMPRRTASKDLSRIMGFVSDGLDKLIILNTNSGEIINTKISFDRRDYSSISANGERIILEARVNDNSGTLILDGKTGQQIKFLRLAHNTMSDDGSRIVGVQDHKLKIFDENGIEISSLDIEERTPQLLLIGPDNSTVVILYYDRVVYYKLRDNQLEKINSLVIDQGLLRISDDLKLVMQFIGNYKDSLLKIHEFDGDAIRLQSSFGLNNIAFNGVGLVSNFIFINISDGLQFLYPINKTYDNIELLKISKNGLFMIGRDDHNKVIKLFPTAVLEKFLSLA